MSKYPLVLAYPDYDDLSQYDNDELCIGAYGLPIYFRLGDDDNLDSGSWHDSSAALTLKVSFRYKDEGTDPIKIGYSHDASTETLETVVTKTNSGEWKWAHYEILTTVRVEHDVYLNFYNADFRLTCDSELLLTNVTLKNLTTKARAVWKITESEEATENESITGPGTGAATSLATYILVSGSTDLPNDRTLAVGNGLSKVDAGAGATVTLDLADAVAGAGLVISAKVLAVGAGAGITVNANDIALNLASPSGLNTTSGLALDDSVAGAGLIISGKVLAVGAGSGLTVNANDVALTTPGTLTVSTSNNAATNHTHAITSSSNPGAAASLLASDASGYLNLVRLNTDTLADKSGGNLSIAPAGDIILDPTGNDVLPASNYDINLGMLSKKYLTLHAAELWVETLVAQDTIATIGGRVLVGPTTVLTADLVAAGTTITVKHNQMTNGDRVYMEANGKVEFMAITSSAGGSAGAYTYSVTRNLDGSGANDWYAGDAVFNTGQIGNGFIDLYSVRGVKTASQAGPTIVGNVRNSSTYNDWTEHWAIGNLNGLYGYGVDTYGVGLGKYAASNANFAIDATNGLRIRNYTTNLAQWAADGDLFIGTDVGSNGANPSTTRFAVFNTTQTFGNLSAAQGDWFAGDASGKRVFYDASAATLDIIGNVRISDGAGANYGVNVGEALLLARWDGARPYETDYSASAFGHRGQVPTTSGGVLYRPGKFGKGIQVAEATTNLITNPSFEVDGTSWTTVGTFATSAITTVRSYVGSSSWALVNSSGSDAFRYITFTASATTTTVSIWMYRLSGTGTNYLYLQLNASPFTIIGTTNATTTLGEWQRIVVTGATSIGTVYRLGVKINTGCTVYIDAAQAEGKAYATPYCDGSLGTGHAWTGSANASTSTRTAGLFSYPSTNNFVAEKGTLSLWYYEPGDTGTFASLFGWRIDANNYFVVNRVTSSAIKPYIETASGGTGASTGTAGAAQAAGWHHLVATWLNGGGSGSLKMYIDGEQYGSTTAAYVTPSGSVPALEIGSFNSGGQANTVIDDLVILPHILTAEEVRALYASNAPVMVETGSGEFRLTATGKGEVWGNASGLFGKGADGKPSFALLNDTVNATAWGGASETFAAGDLMLGSNASGYGNLVFDVSDTSIFLRIGTTQKLRVAWDNLKYGSDVSAAATTALAIFNSNQTYNSETLDTSDLLIGDNSSSKANILWDKSAGQLKFRSGTSTKSYIDTGGAFVFIGDEDTFNVANLQWKTAAGRQSARVMTYFHTTLNISLASFQGIGTSSGDEGWAEIQGINSNENKYAYARITSNGELDVTLVKGKKTSADSQRMLVEAKSNRTNSRQAILNLQHQTSGTAAAGFGLGILFNGHDAGGNMREMGRVDFAWTDPATGTRDTYFLVATADAGALGDRMIINESGRLSIGGSGITNAPTEFFEFNDSNDKQAVIKADAQALNDDGWGTGAVDYNEYMPKADPTEGIEAHDIVFVRGGKISRRGTGTPMIVGVRGAGISGGLPLHWHEKWISEKEYRALHGDPPATMKEWLRRHARAYKHLRPNFRYPKTPVVQKLHGAVILNPEWDANQAYVSRDQRAEWCPVVFTGQMAVKVRGKVNEGDFIVPSGKGDGYGRAVPYLVEHVLGAVGIAWESKASDGEGTVLCAVGIK